MGEVGKDLMTVALAIVGLATVAVLVSRNANTTGVIGAGSSGFAAALSAAEAPVTQAPSGGGFFSGGGFGASFGGNSAGVGMLEPGAGYTGGMA